MTTTMPMVETLMPANGYVKGHVTANITVSKPMLAVGTPANGYDGGNFTHIVTVSKLSQLQRHILKLAFDNRQREGRDDKASGADLYYVEVMVAHFGFKATVYTDIRKHQGNQQFHPKEIGAAKYAAAAASISRAVRRLRDRGLVTWLFGVNSRWSGVSLTPEGIRAAQAPDGGRPA
jgi:hypothetical protein